MHESLVSDTKLDSSEISQTQLLASPTIPPMTTTMPESELHSDDEEIPVNILPETTNQCKTLPEPMNETVSDCSKSEDNEENEEEEDVPINQCFASKILRRDTMAKKLDDGDSHDVNYDVSSSSDEEEQSPKTRRIPIRSGLAQKIQRRDTMARKLDAPDPVNDIPNQTAEERKKIMHRVSLKLER